MKELLRKCQEVLDSLLGKETEAARILKSVQQREAALKPREDRVVAIESAQTVLTEAKSIQITNIKEKEAIKEDHIKFDNLMREERQAIKNEAGRLVPLQDKEQELFRAQQTLYNAQEALKVEKRDFAARYIAKIKAHFANTGKEPNINDIT